MASPLQEGTVGFPPSASLTRTVSPSVLINSRDLPPRTKMSLGFKWDTKCSDSVPRGMPSKTTRKVASEGMVPQFEK